MNRTIKGQFVRLHQVWDESKWDDGWVDNKGRFRVYRPDCPRAFQSGHALRAHVVYWLKTGKSHPLGTNLHHINGIKLDDCFSNLMVLEHGEHTSHHRKIQYIPYTCEVCQKEFLVVPWRVRSRKREGFPIRFCSLACRNRRQHSILSRLRKSKSMQNVWRKRKGLTCDA